MPGCGTLVLAHHPRARRYVIRVRDDGSVRVTIPRWGSKRGAREFAERERDWVNRQLQRVAEARARGHADALSAEERRALHDRARRELPTRLLELATAHNLTVAGISVRNQRWRWGSCSRTGLICLNWRLVRMPDRIRDYVMIHELMHLRQMNHSPKFWRLVEQACPDYREARAWLRQHGDAAGNQHEPQTAQTPT